MGAKITALFRRARNTPSNGSKLLTEEEPLLASTKAPDVSDLAPKVKHDIPIAAPPRIRDVLSYQVVLNMCIYFVLAFYSLAYDQVCGNFRSHLRALEADCPLAAACLYAPPHAKH